MKFYLIGIKGSGMAALAHLLLDDSYLVEGCDIDKYIFTEKRLLDRNVKIHSLNDKSYKNHFFVIIGHDFMDDFLIDSLNKDNIPYLEYHKFLSFYINKNKLISICGSHGKTTLTGLLSECDEKSSFLRGDGYGRKINDESFFFLESCEYKDHFLEYSPINIIITNIDYDHVDYFKQEKDYINSFKKFASKASFGLINYEDSYKINDPYYFTYGIDNKADFYASQYKTGKEGISGKIYFQKQFITDFSFKNLYGIPLIKDVVCVIAFYYLKKYDISRILNKISNFKMADKRFNINDYQNYVIIDDYAHHPKQMETNYTNVCEIYPDYEHIGIYKPDRISRLLFFKKEINNVLIKFDKAFIIDFDNKSNQEILNNFKNDKIIYLNDINKLIDYLDINKKYTYSLMSSKNLNDIKEILHTFYKN